MPNPVTSKRLLAGVTAGGSGIISAAVPAGKVWIVKTITIVPTGGLGEFVLVTSEPGTHYIWSASTVSEVGTMDHLTWHVLDAGDTLQVATSDPGEPISVLISGTELTLVP